MQHMGAHDASERITYLFIGNDLFVSIFKRFCDACYIGVASVSSDRASLYHSFVASEDL